MENIEQLKRLKHAMRGPVIRTVNIGPGVSHLELEIVIESVGDGHALVDIIHAALDAKLKEHLG